MNCYWKKYLQLNVVLNCPYLNNGTLIKEQILNNIQNSYIILLEYMATSEYVNWINFPNTFKIFEQL
jgi:hypothetical protein